MGIIMPETKMAVLFGDPCDFIWATVGKKPSQRYNSYAGMVINWLKNNLLNFYIAVVVV